jgi:hypothetical protein
MVKLLWQRCKDSFKHFWLRREIKNLSRARQNKKRTAVSSDAPFDFPLLITAT